MTLAPLLVCLVLLQETPMRATRRHFLTQSAALAASSLLTPYVFTAEVADRSLPQSKNDQFGIGAIGMRYQGSVITEKARPYGPIVAIADVDRHVREQARASFGSTPAIFEDYRNLLDRKDVDVVLIATPDHWHTKMLLDAFRAGKDVYIEKPLTLTIDEGKLLTKAVKETGRIVQVGSWQRSDWQFRLAVELVRAGRLGTLRKVTCITGPNPAGGPFAESPVPGHLNWDLWQGQTLAVPYIEERCHYTFRWWYEYSGGKVTDWGAHDIDIAQWAINEHPIAIEGEADLPSIPNGYNVATRFHAVVRYPSGTILEIGDTGRQGTLFEGDQGRIFVNRGTVTGVPVEQLQEKPSPAGALPGLRLRRPPATRTARENWTRLSTTWPTFSTAFASGGGRSPTSRVSIAASRPATWRTSPCVSAGLSNGIPSRSGSSATMRRTSGSAGSSARVSRLLSHNCCPCRNCSDDRSAVGRFVADSARRVA